MKRIYAFHADLSGSKFNFHDMAFTGLMRFGINLVARLSRLRQPRMPGLEKKAYRIPSYMGGRIRLSVYRPKGMAPGGPCLVHFHGGGFFMEEFGYLVTLAKTYALEAPCTLVYVHYRLAPEHPFPTGLEDCYAALCWVHANARRLGVDAARIAVSGESAGGNLATAVSLLARDRGGPPLAFQMLIYPVVDRTLSTASMRLFTHTPGWNARNNERMWKMYLRDGDGGMGDYASPLQAESLKGLPPAYVETHQFDCLRDEGDAYARRLEEDGVPVEHRAFRGTYHGFEMLRRDGIVKEIIDIRLHSLRSHLYPA